MPRGSGLNLSTCMGDCAFSEVDRCVLASTCSVDVTNNAVGEAVFLEDGVSLEFGVTPKEERRTVSAPLGGTMFNQEDLTTTCNEGYRSSTTNPDPVEECAVSHVERCEPSGLLVRPGLDVTTSRLTCVAVSCLAPTEICDFPGCGGDVNEPIGLTSGNPTLQYGEQVNITCNDGYFFTPSASFRPSCTELQGPDSFYDVFEKRVTLQCGPRCLVQKEGRRCEPLPCPCITPPPNSDVDSDDIRYWGSANVTCNAGFAVATTTPEECNKNTTLSCLLSGTGTTSYPAVSPVLEDGHCAPAPCGTFPVPNYAVAKYPSSGDMLDVSPSKTWVHGDWIQVTCDMGRRGVLISDSRSWSTCEDALVLTVGCEECSFNATYACERVVCPLMNVSSFHARWINQSTMMELSGINGNEIGDSPLYGEKVVYMCDEGYRVNSHHVAGATSDLVACDADCGLPSPICLPVQCPAISVLNSTILAVDSGQDQFDRSMVGDGGVQLFYKDRVTFACDPGFIAVEAGEEGLDACTPYFSVSCNASAQLVGGSKICKPIACNISRLENVATEGIDVLFALGSNKTVTCREGYRAVPLDRSYAHCGDPRDFTARCDGCSLNLDVHCVKVQCSTLGMLPRHSGTLAIQPDVDVVDFGDAVTIRCAPGFRAQGDDPDGALTASASCLDSCSLEAPLTCSRVRCNMTGFPPNNTVFLNASLNASQDLQLYFGEQVLFRCSEGYTSSDESVEGACQNSAMLAECKSTGLIRFVEGTGVCRSIYCPLQSDQFGTADFPPGVANLPYGAVLNVTCDEGHRAAPFGQAFSSCNMQPNYSTACQNNCLFSTVSQCSPVSCNISALAARLGGKLGAFNESLPFGYRQRVNVSCNAGYRYGSTDPGASTHGSLSCASTCSFDRSCEAVVCNASHLPPANAASSTSEAFYGDGIQVTCNAGYVLGNGSLTDPMMSRKAYTAFCQDDGELTRQKESCVLSRCLTKEVPYANWTAFGGAETVLYGDLRVRCNDGFRATGMGFSLCADPEEYDARCEEHSVKSALVENVTCQPVFCNASALNERLSVFERSGRLLSSDVELIPLGDAVDVQCNEGFRFLNINSSDMQGFLRCHCDGTFGSFADLVVCRDFKCYAYPPRFSSVNVSDRRVDFGTIVRVQCEEGYILESRDASPENHSTFFYSECLSNGMLSPPLELEACVPSTCPQVNDSFGVQDPPGITEYKTHVNVTCAEGTRAVEEVSGNAVRWATCDDPAWYNGTCRDFIVAREGDKHCTPIMCPVKPLIDQIGASGTVVSPAGGNILYGHTVNVTCMEGTRFGTSDPAGPRSVELPCNCEFLAYGCEAVVCDVGAQLPGNTFTSDSNPVPFGQEVAFSCQAGFVHESDISHCNAHFNATCADSGSLLSAGGELNCVPLGCDVNLLNLKNATASVGSEALHDEVVTITCNDGYRINTYDPSGPKNATTVCKQTCTFDSFPACRILSCDTSNALPDNAFINDIAHPGYDAASDLLNYSTKLPVSCDPGYWDAEGHRCDFTLDCSADGSVVGADVNCSEYRCEPFVDENDISNNPPTLSYGQSNDVTCVVGHKAANIGEEAWCSMSNNYAVTCGDSCQGYSPIKQCTPVSCNFTTALVHFATAPQSGNLNVAANPVYQDTVQVTCNSGYRAGNQEVDGERTRHDTCTEVCSMGSTEAEDFLCLPVQCNASALDNRWVASANASWHSAEDDINDYDHPSVFKCNDGFLLQGSSNSECERLLKVHCQDNGTITGVEQTCVPLFCDAATRDVGASSVSSDTPLAANTTVTVTCKDGFRVSSSVTSGMNDAIFYETRCDDWDACALSVPKEHCRPVQCQVPERSWLDPVEEVLHYGKTLRLNCSYGYKLNSSLAGECVTSFEVGCASNSSITGFTENCVPIECGTWSEPFAAPELQEQAPLTSSSFQTSYTVTCDVGFRAVARNRDDAGCDLDRHNFSQYAVRCGSCVFESNEDQKWCAPTRCGVFEPAVFQAGGGVDSGVNRWNASISHWSDSSPKVWADDLTVHCALGYRARDTANPVYFESSCKDNRTLKAVCGSPGNECAFSSDQRCVALRCPAVDNVSTALAGVMHGQSVEANCKPGYRAWFSSPALCSMNATFNTTCDDCGDDTGGLSCVPVACDVSHLPEQAGVASVWPEGEVLYGEAANLTCLPGFRPFTDNSLSPRRIQAICKSDCMLDFPRQNDACERIRSRVQYQVPENAVLVNRSNNDEYLYFGEAVHVRCNAGYQTVTGGVSCETEWVVFVHEDGEIDRWNESCVAYNCAEYTFDSLSISVQPNGPVPFGSTVEITCEENSRVSSASQATRQDPLTYSANCDSRETCSYSPVVAKCTSLECMCPVFEDESVIIEVRVLHGLNSVATCKPGYRRSQAPNTCTDAPETQNFNATCREDGCAFDLNGEVCGKVKCDVAGIRLQRSVTGVLPDEDYVLFGDAAQVTCKPGYRPNSQESSANITSAILCTDQCILDMLEPESVCMPLLSNEKYQLPPYTFVEMPDGSNVTSSEWLERRVSFEELLVVHCEAGFKVAEQQARMCVRAFEVTVSEHGVLNGANNTCEPVTCDPADFNVDNGFFLNSDTVPYGSTAEITCVERHRAVQGPGRVNCSAEINFETRCGPDCQLLNESIFCRLCDPSPCIPYAPPPAGTFTEDPETKGAIVLGTLVPVSISCDPGFFAPKTSAASGETVASFIVSCNELGYIEGRDECECPPGSSVAVRSDANGATLLYCKCDSGTYGVPSDGPLECKPCPSNSTSPAGSTTIEQCKCVAGTYAEDAVTGCELCPENSWSEPGSVSVSQCLCVADTYRDAAGICRSCPDNSHSPKNSLGIDSCLCEDGFYGGGFDLCTPCPGFGIETFSREIQGQPRRECYCLEGYYEAPQGYPNAVEYQCVTCPHGSTSDVDARGSEDCFCLENSYKLLNDGFFDDSMSLSTSSDDSVDGYAQPFQCKACPPSSGAPAGSGSISDCECVAGAFFDFNSGECMECSSFRDFTTSLPGAVGLDECFCNSESFNSGGECILCPVGAYFDGDDCYCPPGKIDVFVGARATCVNCPPNTFWTLFDNVVECKACFNHSTSPEGSTSIDSCECTAGFSEPSYCVGEESLRECGPCLPCSAGSYKSYTANEDCAQCPSWSTTPQVGAKNSSSCTCLVGYGYTAGPGSACRRCLAGEFQSYSSECVPCDDTSTSVPGAVSCQCRAGFSPRGSSATEDHPELCESCLPGTFKDTIGAAACEACPPNTISDISATSCACAPGFDGSGSTCSPCAAGTYKDFAGDETCKPCPGHMTSPAGAVSVAQCECTEGFFFVSDAIDSKTGTTGVCEACPAGFYKGEVGAQVCDPCPAGMWSMPSSRSPLDCVCPKGSTGGPGTLICQPCEAGTYKSVPGNVPCDQCPKGSISPTNASSLMDCYCDEGYGRSEDGPCTPCATGTFKNSTGNTECRSCTTDICPSGLYRSECTATVDNSCSEKCSNAPKSSEYISGGIPFDADNCDYQLICTPPAQGIVTDGKTSACGCGPGWTGNERTCTQCAIGLFKNQVGSSLCQACPAGKYAFNENPDAPDTRFGGTVCKQCRHHSFSKRMSAEDGCLCNAGYEENGSGVCERCQPGFFKNQWGAESCATCPERTFTTRLGTVECDPCPPNSVTGHNYTYCVCMAGFTGVAGECTACPSGKFKVDAGSHECQVCPQGTFSGKPGAAVCLPCMTGMYQDLLGQESCKACPTGSQTFFDGATTLLQCECVNGFAAPYNRSESDDFCSPVCPAPAVIAPIINSLSFYSTVEDPVVGDFAYLTCNEGWYARRVPELATLPIEYCMQSTPVDCNANGEWEIPECRQMFCPFPPVEYSTQDKTLAVPYKGVVQVQCDVGYKASNPGAQMPVCQDDCTMSFFNSTCVGHECPPFPELETVLPTTLQERSGIFGDRLQMKCKERYVVSKDYPDESFTECRKEFSPQCIKENGDPDDETFAFTMLATPCVPATCPALLSVVEGIVVNSDTSTRVLSGTSLEISCKLGFMPANKPGFAAGTLGACDGETYEAVCGATDTTGDACNWALPCICKRVTCGAFSPPLHSYVRIDPGPSSGNLYQYDDKIVIRCEPGYKVENTACDTEFSAVCGDRGDWVTPRCVPLACTLQYTIDKKALQLSNGAVKVAFGRDNLGFGNATTARCSIGFRQAAGSPVSITSICSEDCTLAPIPRCEPDTCSPYQLLDQVRPNLIIPSSVESPKTFGDVVTFRCEPGYYMVSNMRLPGLEALGDVELLSYAVFDPPDPNSDVRAPTLSRFQPCTWFLCTNVLCHVFLKFTKKTILVRPTNAVSICR